MLAVSLATTMLTSNSWLKRERESVGTWLSYRQANQQHLAEVQGNSLHPAATGSKRQDANINYVSFTLTFSRGHVCV